MNPPIYFCGGGGGNHRPNRKEKNRVIIILCMYIRREKLDQWPQRGEVLFLKKKIYWNVYSRAGMYVVTHRKCIKMTSSTIPRAVTFRSIYLIRTFFFLPPVIIPLEEKEKVSAWIRDAIAAEILTSVIGTSHGIICTLMSNNRKKKKEKENGCWVSRLREQCRHIFFFCSRTISALHDFLGLRLESDAHRRLSRPS